MILAYSYIRFSSDQQEGGDSIRRQEKLRDAWLKRHPEVTLAGQYTDRAKSGFKGDHIKSGEFGKFLKDVRNGSIPPGSILLVENQDRLSRQKAGVAVEMILSIINAGVKIQLLNPEVLYSDGNMLTLMQACFSAQTSNEESEKKLFRSNSIWDEKRKAALPHGNTMPWWIKLTGMVRTDRRNDYTNAKYELIPERAEAVKKIFKWAATMGTFEVTKRLTREGVPPFGRAKHWARSYVVKILGDRAVLGEWQPMTDGKPNGEPRVGHFPRVISDKEWYAVQAAREARDKRSGRPAKDKRPSVFTGVLYCAVDQCKMHIITRGRPGRQLQQIVSANAVHGRNGIWNTFPLVPFQTELLKQLHELQAADLFADPGAGRVTEIQGRLSMAEKGLATAKGRHEKDPENAMWADQMDTWYGRTQKLREELAEARREAANPLSATWAEAIQLMAQDRPDELRQALQLTVESIHCVIVKHNQVSLCACQVRFNGSPVVRSYLIRHKQGQGGRAPTKPAETHSKSLVGSTDLDLRRPADVAALQRVLSIADVDTILDPLP